MTYHHLSREERYQISALLKEGLTQAQKATGEGRITHNPTGTAPDEVAGLKSE